MKAHLQCDVQGQPMFLVQESWPMGFTPELPRLARDIEDSYDADKCGYDRACVRCVTSESGAQSRRLQFVKWAAEWYDGFGPVPVDVALSLALDGESCEDLP